MILLEIDAGGVLLIEFKRHAPWAIHMNSVPGGIEPSECMEIEAGQFHIFRLFGTIQPVESDQEALVHLCVDLRRFALFEQLSERLVPERLDHGRM